MEDSITQWIRDFKGGGAAAADRICARYFHKVAALAERRLGNFPKTSADGEDIAASVFGSLLRCTRRGSFPLLSDRENLWALLLVLTARKVCDHIVRERAEKRGGGRVNTQADLPATEAAALAEVLAQEPGPESVALLAEEYERLLGLLDERLRAVAVGKLEGYSNEELATRLQCGLRTIERRLELIRRVWQERG